MSHTIRPHTDPAGLNPFAPLDRDAPGMPMQAPYTTATASWTGGAAMPKTGLDYLRALRKRYWVVLATAMLIVPAGILYVLELPDLYRASARIMIEPPRIDERFLVVMRHQGMPVQSAAQLAHYVPDKMALLKSPMLAESAAAAPELNLSPAEIAEATAMLSGLTWRVQPGSNTFDLFLSGSDRSKVAVLLNTLLERFIAETRQESVAGIDEFQRMAKDQAEKLKRSLEALDAQIARNMNSSNLFGVGNRSLPEEKYLQVSGLLASKRAQHEQLVVQARINRLVGSSATPGPHPYAGKIAQLEAELDKLEGALERSRRAGSRLTSDPYQRHVQREYREVKAEIDRLQSVRVRPQTDYLTSLVAQSSRELKALEAQATRQLGHVQETMPQYMRYLSDLRDRDQKMASLRQMQEKIDDFELLVKSPKPPVRLLQAAEEPSEPSGPNRRLYMVIVVVVGLAVGVLLVCALESIDRRIRQPEQLVAGVALPLLGVVPRMRQLAAFYRGGHLWTPHLPNSVEADAFRNLRASLLGVTGRGGRPVVSLLVTSPKPSEGKTTTALNLAATCARCGERTLLIDADLRRSSLRAVFEPAEDIGLIEVLRDELPWQRAVIRTELPTLDVLPVGLVAGVPVEILGTLELAQLLKKLTGHYHRIVIDGPAVLGMADCRMLGRLVDAALLVVRSGTQSLAPVQRTRSMLDQSRVPIAGVVFNGLDEDLENWGGLLTQMYPGHGATLEERPAAVASLSG